MRRLDHRSGSGRWRAWWRIGGCRRAGTDCRCGCEPHRQILAAALAKGMKRALYLAAAVVIGLVCVARADISNQLTEAAKPLDEGVPEVAAVRLQALLKQNLADADWRAVAEKLLQAMVAANQTADALKLLEDPRLRQSGSAIFWHAQLLAGLHRPAEALALYRQAASDNQSSLHSDALFGAAEMLRAMNRPDEALQNFS